MATSVDSSWRPGTANALRERAYGDFVQDNYSRSVRGTLRGLHFQLERVQGKLARVTTGEVFDVAVDVRRSSPTFGRWVGARLSAANRLALWLPPGFAHGFLVLSDFADFLYKCTDYYDPAWNGRSSGTTPRSVSNGRSSRARLRSCRQRTRLQTARASGLSAVKVLITGAEGQVGAALQATAPADCTIVALARRELDITSAAAVDERAERERPDWIFNAAAYTAVDRAEADADRALRVNTDGPAVLANAAQRLCRVLQLSTDFVFDGERSTPYRPDAPTGPLNVYGATKLRGEEAVVRTTHGDAVIVRVVGLCGARSQLRTAHARTHARERRTDGRCGPGRVADLGDVARGRALGPRAARIPARRPSLGRCGCRQLVRFCGRHPGRKR